MSDEKNIAGMKEVAKGETILTVSNLKKSYGKLEVLRDIDLRRGGFLRLGQL